MTVNNRQQQQIEFTAGLSHQRLQLFEPGINLLALRVLPLVRGIEHTVDRYHRTMVSSMIIHMRSVVAVPFVVGGCIVTVCAAVAKMRVHTGTGCQEPDQQGRTGHQTTKQFGQESILRGTVAA